MVNSERRFFMATSAALGAQLLLSACRSSAARAGDTRNAGGNKATSPGADSDSTPEQTRAGEEKAEVEVTATEDLMREHGVIRRAIIVYREAADRLRAKGADSVPLGALQKAARLFRDFGEDYHERKLEEEHLFPALKRAASPAATEVDLLIAQHQRGREITDYILAVTRAPKVGSNARALANALESFARMYEAHAAREDTIVFPAWKKTMSPEQYDKMGERFEDIERSTFGKDGFDDALQEISAVEVSLGLDSLARFTAPPAPKAT
jgi:hemerythrin-like domain-containing protein